MSQFEAVVHMKVRPGLLEQFKKQAAECIGIAAARDFGTLRYDWFLSQDGLSCEVREVFANCDALLQHRTNVRGPIDRLLTESAEHPVTSIYAEPSLQVVRLADSLGAGVIWLSLFDGLSAYRRSYVRQEAAVEKET